MLRESSQQIDKQERLQRKIEAQLVDTLHMQACRIYVTVITNLMELQESNFYIALF